MALRDRRAVQSERSPSVAGAQLRQHLRAGGLDSDHRGPARGRPGHHGGSLDRLAGRRRDAQGRRAARRWWAARFPPPAIRPPPRPRRRPRRPGPGVPAGRLLRPPGRRARVCRPSRSRPRPPPTIVPARVRVPCRRSSGLCWYWPWPLAPSSAGDDVPVRNDPPVHPLRASKPASGGLVAVGGLPGRGRHPDDQSDPAAPRSARWPPSWCRPAVPTRPGPVRSSSSSGWAWS